MAHCEIGVKMASASSYGVVALVTLPTLRLVDEPSLIKFETEYTAYKNKVDDVNKDRTEATKLFLACHQRMYGIRDTARTMRNG